MGKTDQKKVLTAKMLGSFSLTWGNVQLADGKQRESQFSLLMQLVLHNRESGVNRNLIKTVLFEERDLEDVSHALRNVLYNAKQKLKRAGLPEADYFLQEKGVLFWNEKAIPVREDAQEFENAYQAALSEPDLENRLRKLIDACHLYSGSFLAGLDTVVWASQEAKRYRDIFRNCMNAAAALRRGGHRYKVMYDLSLYATNVNPFAEWEVLTMEALIGLGRYDEAQQFYDTVIDRYIAEFGTRSSEYVRDITNKLGEQLVYENESIEDIQDKLKDDNREGGHGYYCPFPVFQELYRTVERVMSRSGDNIFLMLCTIVDSKGNPMRDGPKLTELSERLGQAVVRSVRHSDTVTKYGKGQYLVLLFNTNRENCSIVQNRINSHFLTGRQRTGVSYTVNNVILKDLN